MTNMQPSAGPAFNLEFEPRYTEAVQVTPLIRRIVAQNPSRFTFHGTGTYIIGGPEGAAVIDPGPPMRDHIDALLKALDGWQVSAILVTHTHLDHSPAARPLQEATGAPTYGFGPHAGGTANADAVEEGADWRFSPDHVLKDGDVIEGPGWTFEAVHTPGHTSNHLCFALAEEQALFSGDHVMGWSTSIVSPPDGDMAAYLGSLKKLLDRLETVYYPTHGAPIQDPKPFVASFIRHREAREDQILAAIAGGAEQVTEMVELMYHDVPRSLYPAAARSVLAHLVKLTAEGRVTADDDNTRYKLASNGAERK